jgi:hypothetical protein
MAIVQYNTIEKAGGYAESAYCEWEGGMVMKKPQFIALGFFVVVSMIIFALALSVLRKEVFTEDCVECDTSPEPAVQFEEAGCKQDEPQERSSEMQRIPEPDLPEGALYADSCIPSEPAGSGIVTGSPIIRGTKSLVPLYPAFAAQRTEADFLTLAEAIEAGLARVGESGSVGHVYVINNSCQPLYIMCGEVIFGGKQDRIIAQDTVIPGEKGKKYDVSVFCVESGRWRESEAGFSFTCKVENSAKDGTKSDGSPDPSTLPSLAQMIEERKRQEQFSNLAGRGISYACIASECGEGGQSEVWSRVQETNKNLGTVNATNTYRNNLLGSEVHNRIKDDLEAFLAATENDRRAIGYAFALEGCVLYCDIFASTGLCWKFRYRLIKSYLLDALGEGCNPRFTPTGKSFSNFWEWVENNRLPEKARPGFAFYKSEYLVGYDSTYEGKRLHSGYYYDGFTGK